MAGPERVEVLLVAVNAVPVLVRKTGAVAAVQLLDYGDDSRQPSRWGNPFTTSTRLETAENPPNVWTLKRVRHAERAGEAYKPRSSGPREKGVI